MKRDTYNDVLDNFELNFPTIAEATVHWFPSGRNEITAVLDDGDRVIYNNMSRTIRGTINDSEQLSEEQWRKEFSIKLRNILADKGMNQETLSDLTNISRVTISRYVRGQSAPSSCNLALIARALNCSITELIEIY